MHEQPPPWRAVVGPPRLVRWLQPCVGSTLAIVDAWGLQIRCRSCAVAHRRRARRPRARAFATRRLAVARGRRGSGRGRTRTRRRRRSGRGHPRGSPPCQLRDARERSAIAPITIGSTSVDRLVAAFLEQVLAEPEDAAAEQVQRVVGEVDREPAARAGSPAPTRCRRAPRARSCRDPRAPAAPTGGAASPAGPPSPARADRPASRHPAPSARSRRRSTSTTPSSRSVLSRTWR